MAAGNNGRAVCCSSSLSTVRSFDAGSFLVSAADACTQPSISRVHSNDDDGNKGDPSCDHVIGHMMIMIYSDILLILLDILLILQ